MKLKDFFKQLLSNSTFEKTAIQSEFCSNEYGEKVILKNSKKSAKQLLLIAIVLVLITIYFARNHQNNLGILLFCIIILLLPLLKLINQKPKLTVSKDHLILGNGKIIPWNEIQTTTIEESDAADVASYFKLNITLHTNQTYKITISDLNYSVPEISHIIEYFKKKNSFDSLL